MTVLGLVMPAYAMLYYVTGFKFDPTKGEIAWITIVIGAFLVGLSYLTLTEREGFKFKLLRVLFSLTLMLTTYGCVRVSLTIVQSDSGNVDFIIQAMFYAIPITFVLSAVVIFAGLFPKIVA
jgi:hypothetical protein